MASRPPIHDSLNDETFSRVIGRRVRSPAGEPPPKATQDALTQMAQYRTRAPKGVFRYRTHEEANRDRERWTIEAMVAIAADAEASR